MTGVLLIDKPSGPTSHDVVARIRRATRERGIGHTGTLDPRASGLLPLVLGKATRLASLLSGSDKTYDATVCLGVNTDTDDADGVRLGEPVATLPDDAAIDLALESFRGEIAQVPPAHSAKRIDGKKAYELARRAKPVSLAAATVTVRTLDRLTRDGDRVELRVTASAGFYVRALARDLGARLGCGAHLASLRRTRSGHFDVAAAIPLEAAERLGIGLEDRLIRPTDALPHLPSVRLTTAGLTKVSHGNPVGPEHLEGGWVPPANAPGPVKVLGPEGDLAALGHSRGGLVHPFVVLV